MGPCDRLLNRPICLEKMDKPCLGHQGRITCFLKHAFFGNTKITGTSVFSKKIINKIDRASDSGDFHFSTRECTMIVAVSMIKRLNPYFCDWPLSPL